MRCSVPAVRLRTQKAQQDGHYVLYALEREALEALPATLGASLGS
jgi:hypothetical protein